MNKEPLVFEEFFEMGQEEIASPFITRPTRHLGLHLPLKASSAAALFLIASFTLSFFPAYEKISAILLLFVYFLAGIPALIESIEDLLNFTVNIDVLMTLAAFSSYLIGSGMEGGLLLVLFALSGAMEEAVTARAKGALSSLHKLSPTRALLVGEGGSLHETAVAEIKKGAKILVRANQVAPLDGKVIEGASSVNLVHLTGENFPVTKTVGDEVAAGSRNLDGTLTLEVTRTSANSTLSKIINLVTEAHQARPRLQRWFDQVSQTYAIAIIAISFACALSFPFIFDMPFLGRAGALYRSLAFLIAASPCALIIAIPISYLSAVSCCARNGILLKGGIALDALAACHLIAFDKTGTLTTGELTCVGVSALHEASNEELEMAEALAYSMERNAQHPIAQAMTSYGEKKKLALQPLEQFRSIAGSGLQALVKKSGKEVFIGHPEYIRARVSQESAQKMEVKIEEARQKGELVAVMMIEQDLFLFRFHDTLRQNVQEVIASLKKMGIRSVMLTGDHKEVARRIAESVGIDEYFADLKPKDKLDYIARLSLKEGLAMIGDGVNDAPALARATVGICMGKVGSTPAIDAADIVLLRDNIDKLDWLAKMAGRTQAIVRQNLVVATCAIIIASIPALAGIVPLWLAVILHEGGTVLVGINGLRLLRN